MELTDDQILLMKKVLSINSVIHCEIIADGYRPGLKKSFHSLEKVVGEELKRLEKLVKYTFSEYLLKILADFVLVISPILLVIFLFSIAPNPSIFISMICLVVAVFSLLYSNYLRKQIEIS